MRLESIQELKRAEDVRAALRTAGSVAVRPLGGRPEDFDDGDLEARAPIALGAAPTDTSGDYRLAIRVQDAALLESPEVERIADAASGEVDVAYIGIGFKESGGDGTDRVRPLELGSSIGHPRIKAGTLGCFVEAADGVRILSNNHVLADEDQAVVGDEIVQPGRYDGGATPRDTVALLDKVVPLTVGRGNRMDAATAKLLDGVDFVAGDIAGVGTLAGTAPLEGREPLAKLGRTSRLTRGRIVTLELDDVLFNYDRGDLYFDDVIEVAGLDGRFTRAGDSGSLVWIDQASPHAVGLHFGGLPNGNSAITALPAVLQELGMALVT